MTNIMKSLFALQTLELQSESNQSNREDAMEAIRKTIPNPILAHYDQLLTRGKKGVAVVRNGVCTECHLCVARGTLADLANRTDIQVCGNCGRYLFLPENEPSVPVMLRAPFKVAKGKRESLACAG